MRPQDDFHERARPGRIKYGVSSDFDDPYEGAASLPPETLADFVHQVDDQLPRASVEEVIDAGEYVADRIGIDHVGFGSEFNQSAQVIGWKDSSEALNVTRELVRRGYSEEEIAKIWSGNFSGSSRRWRRSPNACGSGRAAQCTRAYGRALTRPWREHIHGRGR